MKTYIIAAALSLIGVSAAAHEFTPTYPKFRQSMFDNIVVTTMMLFNRREDVQFYELGVFDEDFNRIPFASPNKIIRLEYLKREQFEVYIRESDLGRVEFICTTSKLLKDDTTTGISSKICSRVR